jgi:hypothetical protein
MCSFHNRIDEQRGVEVIIAYYARRDHSQTCRLNLAQAVLAGNPHAKVSKRREHLHKSQKCWVTRQAFVTSGSNPRDCVVTSPLASVTKYLCLLFLKLT